MFRLKAVLLTLVILVCPLALCYGQFSFSGVNGERGYAALRGYYRMDLDTGFILTPAVGYYRISDDDDLDVAGATTRYVLGAEYELTDDLTVGAGAGLIPPRLGFANVSYQAQAHYALCYRCGVFKNPYVGARVGQTRYRVSNDKFGDALAEKFKTAQTDASLSAGTEIGRLNFQFQYDKVISYTSRPPNNVTSNWATLPFMTAVVQGFIRDAVAGRVEYRTPYVSPYAVYSRYQYTELSDHTIAVSAGLRLHLGETSVSGGVEIFEQNRQQNRKTYFSMSAEREF